MGYTAKRSAISPVADSPYTDNVRHAGKGLKRKAMPYGNETDRGARLQRVRRGVIKPRLTCCKSGVKSVASQFEMYERARRRLADANQAFMEMVTCKANPMTREDLVALIRRRPERWGRFAGWVNVFPSRETTQQA